MRYLGEIHSGETATRKMVASLAAKYRKLTFCYEAGPTGYGLQRLIESLCTRPVSLCIQAGARPARRLLAGLRLCQTRKAMIAKLSALKARPVANAGA